MCLCDSVHMFKRQHLPHFGIQRLRVSRVLQGKNRVPRFSERCYSLYRRNISFRIRWTMPCMERSLCRQFCKHCRQLMGVLRLRPCYSCCHLTVCGRHSPRRPDGNLSFTVVALAPWGIQRSSMPLSLPLCSGVSVHGAVCLVLFHPAYPRKLGYAAG